MLRLFCRHRTELKWIVRHMFSSIKDRPDMMMKDGGTCFIAMKGRISKMGIKDLFTLSVKSLRLRFRK